MPVKRYSVHLQSPLGQWEPGRSTIPIFLGFLATFELVASKGLEEQWRARRQCDLVVNEVSKV